jgi:hypothetical protein
MNLIKIFGLVVLGAVLLSFVNDNISHAQTPNPGTILRQEQELEKRKNLPTQIPKSLLEKKTTQQY